MSYRFALEKPDYTDLAAGRVLRSLPGRPALPVRLASEIFQRCLDHRGSGEPAVLYDPCCGAAYHLACIGLLHGENLQAVYASDIDAAVLPAARQNLAMLSAEGLAARRAEIEADYRAFGKESHAVALESAGRLEAHLPQRPIETAVFQANALDRAALAAGLGGRRADIVLSDVPYGNRSAWLGELSGEGPPIHRMLAALQGVLAPGAVVAIAANKGQKPVHAAYRVVDKFQIGKRRITILTSKG